MGITIVIVSGLVAISIIAIVGDYLGKAKGARGTVSPEIIQSLEKRILELEQRVSEQDKAILHLESDVSFTNKLLENTSNK